MVMNIAGTQEKSKNDGILQRKKYKRHRADVNEAFFRCRRLAKIIRKMGFCN
jgi:hypothetical protein